MSGDLEVPKNLTLVPIPPYSPELNPMENIWQYMRANWLSAQIFEDYDAIVKACCDAWNKLIADPARITSIATRKWAEPVNA